MKVYCYNSINREINIISEEHNPNILYNKAYMLSDSDFIMYSNNLDTLYNNIKHCHYSLYEFEFYKLNRLSTREKELENELNLIKDEKSKIRQRTVDFTIKENF